ncbi:MAG: hypothetical protein A3F15_01530 [Candidatus Wildermuthbacteria bacterium RIFCSPHIGHO2_12_FULL_40_12]|uniref:Vitamin K epoxide reductase domain-containing protein n=1 Tax=Candidatus Wildermuthbacteria bacterium RIFCSPHIGHO2_12_FULL_40_12 TaxID=1802457 RepID=A0A1G2REL3_9BACT|nr:MAG: hypothetical protein A3F15_01530 [Candidatus Wildermuthbacteria bacterium RIFCSPHIGHO2_12_FULL_40_12]
MSAITILFFSAVGVLDTLYLIYHKIRGTEVACPFFPKEWCRKVQKSPYSKIFGIPNAFLGFAIFLAIFVLTWLYTNFIVPAWPIQTLILIGFLFSIYFTYTQGFILKAFCTWCLVSAISFTVMFLSVWFF